MMLIPRTALCYLRSSREYSFRRHYLNGMNGLIGAYAVMHNSGTGIPCFLTSRWLRLDDQSRDIYGSSEMNENVRYSI